jgi:hypothetical protein
MRGYTAFGLKCCLIIFLAMLSTACALLNDQGDPETMLNYALSGLSGRDNFAFEGHAQVNSAGYLQKAFDFEGFVVNHNKMIIKSNHPSTLYVKNNNRWVTAEKEAGNSSSFIQMWNPLVKLDQIKAMDKTVDIDADASSGKVAVLTVHADKDHLQKIMKEELRRELEQVSVEDIVNPVASSGHLTEKDIVNMRVEMKRTLAGANTRLQQMLDTLSVQAEYILWVDRTSNLPLKMSVNSVLNYKVAGKDRQETIKANYVFKDYDKQFDIP